MLEPANLCRKIMNTYFTEPQKDALGPNINLILKRDVKSYTLYVLAFHENIVSGMIKFEENKKPTTESNIDTFQRNERIFCPVISFLGTRLSFET